MTGSTISQGGLQEAGITTGVFKAHPVQGTASSKDPQYGMIVWTFYRKQIDLLRASFRSFTTTQLMTKTNSHFGKLYDSETFKLTC